MPKGSKPTPIQLAFVREYLLSKNASDAYRKAGYKSKTPDVDAFKLLVRPSIQALVAAQEKKLEVKFEMSKEKIMRELSAIAFGNMADLFKWDHESAQFIPKNDLTNDQMKFIDSMSVEKSFQEFRETDEETGKVRLTLKPIMKFKVTTLGREKVKALEMLARLLGYDKEASNGVPEYQRSLDEALLAINKKTNPK